VSWYRNVLADFVIPKQIQIIECLVIAG